jgi:hypothetical protein
MKKYCLLICGAGVAILSYTQINMRSSRQVDLINTRTPSFVKIDKHFDQLKKDSLVSNRYSTGKSQSPSLFNKPETSRIFK